MPSFKILPQLPIENTCADLQQRVCTAQRPTHLLFFDHALRDDLVDCRFGETGGDRLVVPAAIRVVWNRRHVGRDVIHELLKSLVERLGGLGLRVDIPRHLLENLERGVNAAVPEKGLSATQLAPRGQWLRVLARRSRRAGPWRSGPSLRPGSTR